MKPTKKQIAKWCAALRSGEYKQDRGCLQSNNGYCCLGVACDIFIPKNAQKRSNDLLLGIMPCEQENAPEWLKIISKKFDDVTGVHLFILNDDGISYPDHIDAFTFDEIADLLEAVYIHEVL